MLEAALGILDSEGLTALTMRRLGAELGVEAMSLYRHVPGKEALLDGIVELFMLEIDLPVDADGDWQDAARCVARSYRLAAHAHPDAFRLVATRPLNTPEALRRLEASLEVMRRAGFDEPTAIVAFRTIAAYGRGFVLEEVTGRALGAQANGSENLLDPRSLSSQELPRIAELAPRLVAADRDAEFELGLELILTGLRAELARLRRERRASPRAARAKPSA